MKDKKIKDINIFEKLKMIIRYFLWFLGFRKVLPSYIVRKIKIKENNESLVTLEVDGTWVISEGLKLPVLVRANVRNKLLFVCKNLPKNITLKIFEGFPSFEDQKKYWNIRLDETKFNFPNLSEDKQIKITQKKIANPITGYSGHQTGGAVDVSLITKDGKLLDMGTYPVEHNLKSITDCKELNETQKKNRKLLLKSMADAGFVNYPLEWWHYSFGDKMWTAYSKKLKAIYGKLEDKMVDDFRKNRVNQKRF